MDREEPTEGQERALTLRADLLAALMNRLRAQGFDVGVQYGGVGLAPWDPWLVIPGTAAITCDVSDGPLFTIGPQPYEFAEDVAEAMRIIRHRRR